MSNMCKRLSWPLLVNIVRQHIAPDCRNVKQVLFMFTVLSFRSHVCYLTSLTQCATFVALPVHHSSGSYTCPAVSVANANDRAL